MFIHHQLLLLLSFYLSIFFLHHQIFAFAGNFLTPHTHLAAFILSDSLRISTSNRKPLLGFGRPYVIANVMIIVITLLNVLVYKLREHQEHNSCHKSTSSSSILSSEQPCRRFSLDEIVSATKNFDSSLVIGKGGFGKVYKGVIDNGASTVAIKRLNSLSKQGATEFWTEINMLSKFRHSHLVCLIGFCDDNNEMIIVYEYMISGSLADHLHKISKNNKNGNTSSLSWVQRMKICLGAARGLDYLHTGTAVLQRVIHRDVKSSNILLDDNLAAKISDFGLCRIGLADQECTTHVSTKHIKGTFGYMDPEYFLTRRITRKSDVYAFGVVLLEILSERPALDRNLDEDKRSLAGWAKQCIKVGAIHKLIGPKLEYEIFPDSLTEFVKIADQCLHSSPKLRPTMSEVVSRLELALALQLRTNLVTEEDSFNMYCPLNNQEYADSYPVGDQTDKILPVGDPVVLVQSNPEPSKDAKTNNNNGNNSRFQNNDRQIASPNMKLFTFDEIQRATNYFRMDEGRFGTIFKGWVDEKTYCPSGNGVGKAVAIKRLEQKDLQKGQTEVEILGKFGDHHHIVKLLGYYREEEKEFFLVYEYMQNRSLDRHLCAKVAKPLAWYTRLEIAVGAARGLLIFHQFLFAHLNISTSHILLDGHYNAKLSGCGRAKRCYKNGGSDIKDDIYCFGVVLLQILTGPKVLEEARTGKINLVDWAKPLLRHKKTLKREVVDPRLENDYPPHGSYKLASLILQCLQRYPNSRPSIKQVLHSLEQIMSIKMKPKVEDAQARRSTVQREVAPYKFLWWIRDWATSNSTDVLT